MKTDPRMYLAVDNCFASKRWTKPAEWMNLLKSMGVNYVEASADNECDPLYMSREYLERWVGEVKSESEKTGVKVANLYSGHGTYTTLGLTHHDKSVRDRIQREWIEPMAEIAASIGAGIGFYCHAFSDSTLQNPTVYREMEAELFARLAKIALHCRDLGILAPGVEQMYTPHQIPWTIEGSKRLLKEVYSLFASPFYLTLDTGHQSGQRKFRKPDALAIDEMAENCLRGEPDSCWLGSQSAYDLFVEMIRTTDEKRAGIRERILEEMKRYPYLFADNTDSDTYRWLEELGCYSPIIHLQQTTGESSSHQPFTEEYNRKGTIFGEPVLRALEKAYRAPGSSEEGMPPKCGEIYLTLEIFSGTSEMNTAILRKIQESVQYWRKFIPEDGMKLSQVLKNLEK
ncbi:TIM barrel protein [Paenibacillus solisilvae]|uniref:TIM barrel protein n=1 Tax=Paenibacillus solisilvae TaxID=2486751 RepID=A0ABW0VYQ4_9BACL